MDGKDNAIVGKWMPPGVMNLIQLALCITRLIAHYFGPDSLACDSAHMLKIIMDHN